MQARGDEAVWWTACLLYANTCMVPLGPALSFVGLFAFAQAFSLPRAVVTVDVSFQVFNVIVLSGMVGSTPMNLETLQKLAELSGFGLAAGNKRVPFTGHVSEGTADCVVSFPGKYSELWDKAVSSTDAFSLACVFLTDVASGLGRHADNPETPGKCWCQTIYGRVPSSTYLSVVEISTDESRHHDQMLAFKRADAEAMGQRLLVKQHQGDIEWEQELAEALQDAEVRCSENQDRAPGVVSGSKSGNGTWTGRPSCSKHFMFSTFRTARAKARCIGICSPTRRLGMRLGRIVASALHRPQK